MRYQPQKYPYLFISVLLVLYAAFLSVLLFQEPFYDARDNWVVLAVCCVLLPGIAGVLCYQALRSGAWAMIEDDGIHIFSRKQGKLVFVPWADARACRFFQLPKDFRPISRRRCMILQVTKKTFFETCKKMHFLHKSTAYANPSFRNLYY